MSKTRNINIRVSEQQLEIIREHARRRGMKLTEYIISRAVMESDESFTDEIISLVFRHVRGIPENERTDTEQRNERNE